MRSFLRSRTSFQSSLAGRLMLPVGFALAVAVGTYVVAEDSGYLRGKAEQAGAQQAQESVKTLARLVAQPVDLAEEPTDKGDQLDIPTMIRAIEPGAVYKPPQKAAKPAATSAATRTTHAGAAPLSSDITVADLPAGVERFDQCGARCDSRDPMVRNAPAPVAGSAAPAAAAAPASVGRPLDLAAAEPGVLPPAPVVPRESEKKEGFLGLPPIPTATEIVDRTVEGTSRAYDGMKQAVNGALDLWR
jgi:hypothetical protein